MFIKRAVHARGCHFGVIIVSFSVTFKRRLSRCIQKKWMNQIVVKKYKRNQLRPTQRIDRAAAKYLISLNQNRRSEIISNDDITTAALIQLRLQFEFRLHFTT